MRTFLALRKVVGVFTNTQYYIYYKYRAYIENFICMVFRLCTPWLHQCHVLYKDSLNNWAKLISSSLFYTYQRSRNGNGLYLYFEYTLLGKVSIYVLDNTDYYPLDHRKVLNIFIGKEPPVRVVEMFRGFVFTKKQRITVLKIMRQHDLGWAYRSDIDSVLSVLRHILPIITDTKIGVYSEGKYTKRKPTKQQRLDEIQRFCKQELDEYIEWGEESIYK